MTIMLKILENDLHRSRNENASPLIIEVPAFKEFVPAIVSNSVGDFLVSRKLTNDSKIRVGVFQPDSNINNHIEPMLSAALKLSKDEGWCNIFDSHISAFKYVSEQSCMPAQPHVCLIPDDWEDKLIFKKFGIRNIEKYKKYCRIVKHKISYSVFLSKPDMVGLYTHFSDGPSAILLHNIKKGMAFVL